MEFFMKAAETQKNFQNRNLHAKPELFSWWAYERYKFWLIVLAATVPVADQLILNLRSQDENGLFSHLQLELDSSVNAVTKNFNAYKECAVRFNDKIYSICVDI